MNTFVFLIVLTCVWSSGSSQSIRTIIYLEKTPTDNRDTITQLKLRAVIGWSDGKFSNPFILDADHRRVKYEVTVNSSKYPAMLPNEMLWVINFEMNGLGMQCFTNAEYSVQTVKCYEPYLSERRPSNQLSITGPVTNDFCDKLEQFGQHDMEACCLEQVFSSKYDRKPIGEYRILYRTSEKFGHDIAWRNLQSALNILNENNFGCAYNAYWLD
ncbi:hypothetical protein P879_02466 [Paragonimus westermani]|uniref:Uncharacterized protein n=1 Tax=Paragonimus westermani TaxID=34504 RepID=A0A8T0DPT1_9TREM|nr:hypothetical protein P879_02466 [Paragonimus westermani]